MPWIKQPAYNITAPGVIVPGVSSRLNFRGYNVLNTGTAGNLILNDCATLAQASAANIFISCAYGAANTPIPPSYKWPLTSGLCVSALPTGMVLTILYEILLP